MLRREPPIVESVERCSLIDVGFFVLFNALGKLMFGRFILNFAFSGKRNFGLSGKRIFDRSGKLNFGRSGRLKRCPCSANDVLILSILLGLFFSVLDLSDFPLLVDLVFSAFCRFAKEKFGR